MGCWLPGGGEFLSGEALDSGVMQNTWQRSRKAKAVRQHVFGAGSAEFATEEAVAIENLPEDRLSVRRIHVPFLHRGARRKPSTGRDVLLESCEINRVI